MECVIYPSIYFQVLISGAHVPISLEDLKKFTNYSGITRHTKFFFFDCMLWPRADYYY